MLYKRLIISVLMITCLFSCIRKTDVLMLRDDNLVGDLAFIDFVQRPVFTQPLTFEDIVEIAFTYNLDMYAQQFEREAQARLSNAEQLRMLPTFSLDGFYNVRSKTTASVSKTFFPDDQNISQTTSSSDPDKQQVFPQISSIKTTFQDDVRLTVNFLDMGLAYFQAKQEKERTLIIEQQHLRARQKLILDLSESYWRAVTAKKTVRDVEEIVRMTKGFQATINTQIQRRVISELEGLQISSRLSNQLIQLQASRYQYQSAMAQLVGLMGLPPDVTFELADVGIDISEVLPSELPMMEDESLRMRPELFVRDLEELISTERIKQSILSVLPNSAAYYDNNYDANPFLIHNYWWSLGARATWNLLMIPQKMQEKRSAEAQRRFSKTSRLALSITVLAQVHLAYLNYQDALNQYKVFLSSYEIRNRLANVSAIVQRAGEFQSIDVLNFRTDALLGEVNLLRAYANFKLAEEQLNYAIGRPFYMNELVQCRKEEKRIESITPVLDEGLVEECLDASPELIEE